MQKEKANIIFGLVLIVICIFLYQQTLKFPIYYQRVGYGPGFYPKLLIFSIVIFSLVLIIQSLLNLNKGFNKNSNLLVINNFKSLSTVIILFVLYLLLFSSLGFFVDSFLFLAITMIFLNMNFWKSISIALLFSIVIYYIFASLLRVPVPTLVNFL